MPFTLPSLRCLLTAICSGAPENASLSASIIHHKIAIILLVGKMSSGIYLCGLIKLSLVPALWPMLLFFHSGMSKRPMCMPQSHHRRRDYCPLAWPGGMAGTPCVGTWTPRSECCLSRQLGCRLSACAVWTFGCCSSAFVHYWAFLRDSGNFLSVGSRSDTPRSFAVLLRCCLWILAGYICQKIIHNNQKLPLKVRYLQHRKTASAIKYSPFVPSTLPSLGCLLATIRSGVPENTMVTIIHHKIAIILSVGKISSGIIRALFHKISLYSVSARAYYNTLNAV